LKLREDKERLMHELDNKDILISKLRESTIEGLTKEQLKEVLGDDFNEKMFDQNKELRTQNDELTREKRALELALDKERADRLGLSSSSDIPLSKEQKLLQLQQLQQQLLGEGIDGTRGSTELRLADAKLREQSAELAYLRKVAAGTATGRDALKFVDDLKSAHEEKISA